MLVALQWCSSTEMCGVKSQEAFKPVASAGMPPGEHPEDCLARQGNLSYLVVVWEEVVSVAGAVRRKKVLGRYN